MTRFVKAVNPGKDELLQAASRRQSRVSWFFATAGLLLYFSYVGLMAFDLPVLRATVPGTRSITGAIVLGYAMILMTVLLTMLFVLVNARYVQPLLLRLREEHGESHPSRP